MARKKDPEETTTGVILQRSGNGVGPQILVRPDEMSPPQLTDGDSVSLPKGRKTKLAAFGLSPTLLAAGDPEYAQCLHAANKYRKVRIKELGDAHGSVSSAVCSLTASAALCLAASRYLFQRAAGEGGNPDLLKLASKMTSDARQNDLAAWELCARENATRKRLDASIGSTPWALTDGGDELQKPGRKTALERALSDGVVVNSVAYPGGPE